MNRTTEDIQSAADAPSAVAIPSAVKTRHPDAKPANRSTDSGASPYPIISGTKSRCRGPMHRAARRLGIVSARHDPRRYSSN